MIRACTVCSDLFTTTLLRFSSLAFQQGNNLERNMDDDNVEGVIVPTDILMGVFDWAVRAPRFLENLVKAVNAKKCKAQNTQCFTIISMKHFFFRKASRIS